MRLLWPALALPGMVWIALLFVLPLYVVLAIVFGRIDPVFRTADPVWSPLDWDFSQFTFVLERIVGEGGYFGPALVRTAVYVLIASSLCVLIAYPVAYYTARYAGRRKALLLTLLIAPFWISYMMRMLAWVNLLQDDGLVNRALSLGGLFPGDVNWLDGRSSTVVLGLVYGYVPYMILPLQLAGVLAAVYFGDPERSVWYDDSLQTALVHTLRLGVITTLFVVPLGVALALGLDRWRGRLPAGANFTVLLAFVLPETLLAVALLFVVTALVTPLQLGLSAQVAGLVTFQLSYPVIIVRARLLTIGPQYEEAAVDLGASPLGAVRRVLLPMLAPAILASAVLVFADVIDDFVIVRYLTGDAATESTSVKIYNSARVAPTPALNALASLLLATSLLAIVIGFGVYRFLTRGQRTNTQELLV